MSTRNIKSGKWVNIDDLVAFSKFHNGRFNYGNYRGPDRYYILEYQQQCPRGCCYDDVVEILSSYEVIQEVKEEMLELAEILRNAKHAANNPTN